MNWKTYFCPRCNIILTSQHETDLTFHCGIDGDLHMLVFCKSVGEYPASWEKDEVMAQARYQVENFGLIEGQVAHG